jgi:adenosylcobyric acid synthase
VFASLLGTLVALSPEDQRHVAGFVINKFRGDHAIVAPGLEQITALTGRPTLGVLPFVEDLGIDAEDSLAIPDVAGGDGTLDVAVVRLRWMSNFTDLDALAREPGVRVRFTRSAADVARADLVVLPGTKATVEDLGRLRADGLDAALAARAAARGPILGLCGGYQLLGESIRDDVESGAGEVAGLGLLPVTTTFAAHKVLRTVSGRSALLGDVSGYEIRHGRPVARGPALIGADEGCVAGSTLGTSWHGLLEHDGARRALLRWVASRRNLAFAPQEISFAAERERQLDVLGDLVERHLDTGALSTLIDRGVPTGLPDLLLERAPC